MLKLFNWFDGVFQPLIPSYFYQHIPGLGFLIGILVILGVGVFAPSLIGKQLIRLTESVVHRLPLAKLIYTGTKQIFDSFSETNVSKFSRVVMIPFPRDGTYVIAFVTKEVKEGWVPGHPENKLSIFIPTTPNPTSGYLAFYKPSETIPLDITVDDALKVIISGGMVRPPDLVARTSQINQKS